MGVEPKIGVGKPPQIIHFNRVFHEMNHPFWGTPIFGNTHIEEKDTFFCKKKYTFPHNSTCKPLKNDGVQNKNLDASCHLSGVHIFPSLSLTEAVNEKNIPNIRNMEKHSFLRSKP